MAAQDLGNGGDADRAAVDRVQLFDDGLDSAVVEVGDAEIIVSRSDIALRRALGVTAVVLFVLLVALVAFLLFYGPNSAGTEGRTASPGLEPVLVIEGPGEGAAPTFANPMGVAWGPDNKIYVADTGNNRVCVFEENGRFLFQFGTFGIAKPLPGARATWKGGSLNYPTGISVDSLTGEIYVADFYNNTIEVFDREGSYRRNFPDPNTVTGKGGSGIGGTGIAVTDVAVEGGRVYATDSYQVLVFDRSGTLLRQFGKPGAGPEGLDRPNGVTVGENGAIFVADSNHNRIVKYDQRGRPLQVVGEQVKKGGEPTPNPFVLPRGLSVLDDGSVIVADPLGMELVRIDAEGKPAGAYGSRGAGPALFNFPNDVDASGRLLLVADRGNHRVQVVRMLGE